MSLLLNISKLSDPKYAKSLALEWENFKDAHRKLLSPLHLRRWKRTSRATSARERKGGLWGKNNSPPSGGAAKKK